MSIALQPAPPAAPVESPANLPPAPPLPLPRADERLYRLSVAQYHAMGDAGILGESDRVHLIEGLLVFKMPKNEPHNIATDLLSRLLHRIVPEGWFASMQNPISIEEAGSEPEPDGKVVRGDPNDYHGGRKIVPADVGLVVEVANSSVREDQTTMKALYARAGIPIYWLVNLPARRLEVYSDPTGPDPSPDYRRRTDLGPDQTVPLILDGQEFARIAVSDLLPRFA